MSAQEDPELAPAARPKSVTTKGFFGWNRAHLIGFLLLLCALTFYYFAVLRIDYTRTVFLDLGPYPDATEYFGQAEALGRGKRPQIQIGYDKLPSRYPPGYPVLMLPWLKLLPAAERILAPFRTNETIGVFLLLAVFAFYCWRRRPLDGGLTAVLLATLPGFISFSRSSLSEVSGSALVLLTFVLIYVGLQDKRRWQIYLGALVLGGAVNVRMQLIFFAPVLVAMAVFPAIESRAKWFLHCVMVLIVFVLAVSPLLVLNTIQFGDPLKTGYDFWVTLTVDQGPFFSVHNIVRHAAMIGSEVTGQWKEFRIANLFGTGTYFVPTFAILTVGGLCLMRPARFQLCALLAVFSFSAATAMYRFVDGRFYLPVLFLCVAVAEVPVGWAIRTAITRKVKGPIIAMSILFALTCVGYPSQSGYKPIGNRFQAWDALCFATVHWRSSNFEAQQTLVRRCGHEPGIVFSTIDPVYLNALLPRPFVAAPLDERHHYAHSRVWHYGKAEASDLVRRGLSDALPIYGLFSSSNDFNQNSQRLPILNGYKWVEIDHHPTQTVILRLIPVHSA